MLPIVTEFVSNEKYADKDALTSKDDSIFFIIGSVFVKYSNMINYGLLLAILISIIFLFKKFKIKSILTTVKYSLLSLLFTALVAGLSYGISRLAAVINGRPFKLTYLPLIKFEDVTTLGVIGLSIAGYILLIRKVSNKFKERNEVILGNIVFLFILGLILTFVLPGGSYLLVFPAIIIALGTIVVELLKDKLRKVSYILLIPAALITILYVPTVYLFNCALTFGALCATMVFAMFGIISVVTCLVQID